MPYTPKDLPRQQTPELQKIVQAIQEEFHAIERAQNEAVSLLQLATLHVEPKRPREGMIVVADGADWDPGLGAGLYIYAGGAWEQVLAF